MRNELTVRGQTGNMGWVFIQDTASLTGAGKTALNNASPGLIIAVRRERSAAVTAYSGANIGTITTLGAWAAPAAGKVNFKEVDATNMPGLYEMHFLDSIYDASDSSRKLLGMVQVTGGAPAPFEVSLAGIDVQDSVHGGMSALPNTACTTNGSLITAGSGAAQMSGDPFPIVNSGSYGNAALLGALTTVNNTVSLINTKTDVATSTRLAASAYTAPDNASVATILTRTDVATSTRLAASAYTAPDNTTIAAIKVDTSTLLGRITITLFAGITSIAQWLGMIAGKQIGNATARTELRATGAGAGTFDETTDSLEALQPQIGTGGGGGGGIVNEDNDVIEETVTVS